MLRCVSSALRGSVNAAGMCTPRVLVCTLGAAAFALAVVAAARKCCLCSASACSSSVGVACGMSGVRCREPRHLLSCHFLAIGGVRLRGQSSARVGPPLFKDAVFNC